MLKHITAIAAICGCVIMPARAQECSTFLFLQKDKTIEMTIYNKKGEPNGKQVYLVSDVTNSGGTTTGKLASEMFDKKGKSIAKANSSVQCNGGVFSIDMRMMLPQQQAEQAWIQYRDANCKFYYTGQGTIRQVQTAECFRAMTQDRALELEQSMKFGD